MPSRRRYSAEVGAIIAEGLGTLPKIVEVRNGSRDNPGRIVDRADSFVDNQAGTTRAMAPERLRCERAAAAQVGMEELKLERAIDARSPGI